MKWNQPRDVADRSLSIDEVEGDDDHARPDDVVLLSPKGSNVHKDKVSTWTGLSLEVLGCFLKNAFRVQAWLLYSES